MEAVLLESPAGLKEAQESCCDPVPCASWGMAGFADSLGVALCSIGSLFQRCAEISIELSWEEVKPAIEKYFVFQEEDRRCLDRRRLRAPPASQGPEASPQQQA